MQRRCAPRSGNKAAAGVTSRCMVCGSGRSLAAVGLPALNSQLDQAEPIHLPDRVMRVQGCKGPKPQHPAAARRADIPAAPSPAITNPKGSPSAAFPRLPSGFRSRASGKLVSSPRELPRVNSRVGVRPWYLTTRLRPRDRRSPCCGRAMSASRERTDTQRTGGAVGPCRAM